MIFKIKHKRAHSIVTFYLPRALRVKIIKPTRKTPESVRFEKGIISPNLNFIWLNSSTMIDDFVRIQEGRDPVAVPLIKYFLWIKNQIRERLQI